MCWMCVIGDPEDRISAVDGTPMLAVAGAACKMLEARHAT